MTRPFSRQELLRAMMGGEVGGVPASFYELNPYDPESWYCKEPSYRRLVNFAREHSDVFGFCGLGTGLFLPEPDLVEQTVETEKVGDSTFTRTVIHTPKGDLTARRRSDEGVLTSWGLEYFLKTEEDAEAFFSLPYTPPSLDFSSYHRVDEQLGEKGVPTVGVADALCEVASLCGFETLAYWCKVRLDLIAKLVEVMSERLVYVFSEMVKHTQRTAYRIVGPEYATPPLMAPEFFDRFVVPHDSKLIEIIRSAGRGNIAIIHCHGRLDAVLEKIVGMGPHVLEPLEPPPQGDVPMKDLRRRVGRNICLMGYMQFRDLEFDTEEETARKVKAAIRDGYEEGRLIFIPTAFPIVRPLPEKTERNLMRFVSTAKEFEP